MANLNYAVSNLCPERDRRIIVYNRSSQHCEGVSSGLFQCRLNGYVKRRNSTISSSHRVGEAMNCSAEHRLFKSTFFPLAVIVMTVDGSRC